MKTAFRWFAERIASAVGTPWAFIAALTIIFGCAVTGPLFAYSEPWQLAVNSFTTIVTFLMVFIIQNTQERDFKAMQLKLDALIHVSDAHSALMGVQEFTDEELQRLESVFRRLRGRRDFGEIERTMTELKPSDRDSDRAGDSQ